MRIKKKTKTHKQGQFSETVLLHTFTRWSLLMRRAVFSPQRKNKYQLPPQEEAVCICSTAGCERAHTATAIAVALQLSSIPSGYLRNIHKEGNDATLKMKPKQNKTQHSTDIQYNQVQSLRLASKWQWVTAV